jgi:hypothetical protein
MEPSGLIKIKKYTKSDCRKSYVYNRQIQIRGEEDELRNQTAYKMQMPVNVSQFRVDQINHNIDLRGKLPDLNNSNIGIWVLEEDNPKFYNKIIHYFKKLPKQAYIEHIMPRLWIKGTFTILGDQFNYDSGYEPPDVSVFFDQKPICPHKPR